MLKFYRFRRFCAFLIFINILLSACGTDTTAASSPVTKLVHTDQVTTNAANISVSAQTSTPVLQTAALPATPFPTLMTAPDSFSGTLAFQHVKKLAEDIGIRYVGTAGQNQSTDYLEGYYRSLAYKVERPVATYLSTKDKGSYLRYNNGAGKLDLKGIAVTYSGSGVLDAPLSYIGYGLAGQIPANSLNGKIALIMRGQITFEEKVSNAKNAGAKGVVIFNNIAGELETATLARQSDLPVLAINQENGQKLRELLDTNSNNLQVTLEVNLESTQASFSNVVAIRPSVKDTAPIIIIGGHYDSVAAGPGANDNASGTAVVMELGRVLALRYPKYEFRFIGFGAEEEGLVGSTAYVQALTPEERQRVVAMINIDMISVGDTLYIGGSPSLTRLAFNAASEVGVSNVAGMPADIANASDHAPFASAGMPVLFLNRENDPNYHRATDTLDKVLPKNLEMVGNIVIKVIENIPGN
jgi:aminopeptidase YwaD